MSSRELILNSPYFQSLSKKRETIFLRDSPCLIFLIKTHIHGLLIPFPLLGNNREIFHLSIRGLFETLQSDSRVYLQSSERINDRQTHTVLRFGGPMHQYLEEALYGARDKSRALFNDTFWIRDVKGEATLSGKYRGGEGERVLNEAKLNKRAHIDTRDGKGAKRGEETRQRRKIVRGREDREAFSTWRSGARALLLAMKKGGLKASGKKSHFDAAVHSAAVSRFLDIPKKSSFGNRVGPAVHFVCSFHSILLSLSLSLSISLFHSSGTKKEPRSIR